MYSTHGSDFAKTPGLLEFPGLYTVIYITKAVIFRSQLVHTRIPSILYGFRTLKKNTRPGYVAIHSGPQKLALFLSFIDI